MDKLVSVIIPTHGGQDTIARAVRSALNQTYKNVEILICDDNGEGTENQVLTQNALLTLIENDNRIKYIVNKENKNGSVARNTAMKSSSGEYIAFLDDDDEYMPNCLEKEVEAFERLSDDYGIVFASFVQTGENVKDIIHISSFDGNISGDFMLGKIESPSSIIAIRREVIDTIGYWDESFFRHQDWEYIIRITDKYKAYGLSDVLVRRNVVFRHNPKQPELYEKYRLHFLTKMEKYIKKQPKEIQKKIYNRHMFDIGKAYLKSCKFLTSIKYAFKTTNPLSALTSYFTDMVRHVLKRV